MSHTPSQFIFEVLMTQYLRIFEVDEEIVKLNRIFEEIVKLKLGH